MWMYGTLRGTRGGGGAPKPFRWCVWHLLAFKNTLHSVVGSAIMFSSCWCGACLCWWFGLSLIDLSFFSPSVSLSSPENYSLAILVVGISTSVLILLIFYFFYFGPFLFIFFQFHYLILIYQILYSLIRSSFVGFLILCLGFFCKSFMGFNFILQFK